MPIATPAFEMTLEEYSKRYLAQNPWATPDRCKMEWLNAQSGPQLAAGVQRATERRLSGVDLIATLEQMQRLVEQMLGTLRNTGAKP